MKHLKLNVEAIICAAILCVGVYVLFAHLSDRQIKTKGIATIGLSEGGYIQGFCTQSSFGSYLVEIDRKNLAPWQDSILVEALNKITSDSVPRVPDSLYRK